MHADYLFTGFVSCFSPKATYKSIEVFENGVVYFTLKDTHCAPATSYEERPKPLKSSLHENIPQHTHPVLKPVNTDS